MAATSQFGSWISAARGAWPNLPSSSFSGDGRFAFISDCGMFRRIRLFQTWGECAEAGKQECGSHNCDKKFHTWRKLEPIPQKFIKRPSWAKMMDQA